MTTICGTSIDDFERLTKGKTYTLHGLHWVLLNNKGVLQSAIVQEIVDEVGTFYVTLHKRSSEVAYQILGQRWYIEILVTE
jgi:hypothetical protein